MDEYRIVGWASYDSNYPTKEVNENNLRHVLYAVRKEIMDNRYLFSGEEHQNAITGVPVFEDGTCFRASMRCWGTIMASIYKGENREKLSYMDFYMSTPQELILPEEKEICVTPKEINEDPVGYYTKEDVDVLAQALNFDLEFMTTDKVLQKMYKEMMSDN